ncbi:MAG: thioredoxin family protein [Candidatus Kapabacteria bacterium]|nr:thioredoxin family protein [Ignavibacteriota bacterium]MCW5886159.1 thioredoxin family protein [Candidatus Kapabacteria bacterium]
MAATPSNMLALGTTAPDFELFNPVVNKNQSLNELKSGIATVIMFICNHCPYVIHINSTLVELSNEYIKKGISFIGINSNDVVNYPQDSPEKMKLFALKEGYNFPYLFDETQDIAKAYHAACTPDIYVFDKDLKLVYRGQFDNSRPNNGLPVTGSDLASALDALIRGEKVNNEQTPSIGCNIKWK